MARRKPTSQPAALEIDLHGLHCEQAESRLLAALSAAAGQSGRQIQVIHGRSSHILKNLVEQIGRRDPRVASVEPSFFNPGVTVLTLSDSRKGPEPGGALSRHDWNLPPPPIRKKKR